MDYKKKSNYEKHSYKQYIPTTNKEIKKNYTSNRFHAASHKKMSHLRDISMFNQKQKQNPE